MTPDLGPKPEPEIEPHEPNPGGVDAINENDQPPMAPNLPPEDNPAVEDHAPDEIRQPDGTDTEATSDGASQPTKESPA
jgi:hypothetical protein